MHCPPFIPSLALALLLGAGLPLALADDPKTGPDKVKPKAVDGAKPPRNPEGKRPFLFPGGDADPFRDLSPEQRDKLREAVRRVWSDPEVIQARDEVKAATQAYQTALRAALGRTDPETAKAIEKIRQSSESESRGLLSPGLPFPTGGPGNPAAGAPPRDWRDFESALILENPAFLRDLDDDKKSRYREAHRKAMEDPEVRTRVEAVKTLRREDDNIRQKRTEAIRGMHQALRRALLSADPGIADFLPKIAPEDRLPGDAPGPKPGN